MDWKSEDGAIIVEATISLSTFMFFIVTLLTIVNICYVQSKMGIAINERQQRRYHNILICMESLD